MNEGAKQAVVETAKKAEEVAEETVRHPLVIKLAQVGFYAKGVLFIVIGLLAILLSIGSREGKITDPAGAIATIGQSTLGKVVLTLFVIGAVGHGLWNILRGFADVDDAGKGVKGIVARSASVGIGIFYFFLAWTAGDIIFSSPVADGNSEVERTLTALLLTIPLLGVTIVFLIGMGFFGAAAHECYSGITGKYQENYRSWKIDESRQPLINFLGVVSFSLRALLYVLVGYFFVSAAVINDPDQAEGIDGALLALAQTKFGGILLFIAAFGLVCHGILAFFEAKYRRIC